MVKIKTVTIQRFRSIMDITLDIDLTKNSIAICGQNNVGKTNTLRALNLFFHPEEYNPKTDIPTIKYATWGASVHSKITIEFYSESLDCYYSLIRDFKIFNEGDVPLSGVKYNGSNKRKINKITLDEIQINAIIKDFEFIYIESVNTIIPDLIEKITQDMITIEYDKVRFSKSKSELRTAYNTYVDGLQSILNGFSEEISETFRIFKNNWSIKLDVPKNSDTFRDLISDDVTLSIEDLGPNGIQEKGSGLQRLALILLNFEIADRITKKKNIFICIDEPDIFLHEGLQKKLKKFIDEKSINMQIFYTTHSRIFIDAYQMKNVILLTSKSYDQFVTRKNRIIDIVETIKEDIDTDLGYRHICEHLGIEEKQYEMLNEFNLLVEGGCDKKYISELFKFFGIKEVNIITANGADNIMKFLDFYDGYYRNSSLYNPKIKIVLDNDSKGREILKKIQSKQYQNIKIKSLLIPNFLNDSDSSLEKNNTNNEIEDFIYPELFCYLVNILLKKKSMCLLNTREICRKIGQKSFRCSGILTVCEHEKNDKNPDSGGDISFVSSNENTNRLKEGIAGIFNIEGNQKLIQLLNECDKQYPKVKENFMIILSDDFVD
jgi:predicted ATP-dependent endonuclease of OLD family